MCHINLGIIGYWETRYDSNQLTLSQYYKVINVLNRVLNKNFYIYLIMMFLRCLGIASANVLTKVLDNNLFVICVSHLLRICSFCSSLQISRTQGISLALFPILSHSSVQLPEQNERCNPCRFTYCRRVDSNQVKFELLSHCIALYQSSLGSMFLPIETITPKG